MEKKSNTLFGTVSWFNAKMNFGFIMRDDGEKDIFVHYSDLNQPGFKLLMADDRVSFEEGFNYKERLKATNVILLERNSK